MDFNEKRILGRTGIEVGRLGVSAGYGAPAAAFEEAFERGCNYFYWGSIRKPNMVEAMKNISRSGRRDKLVVLLQVYNRIAGMMASSVERGLKKAGLDHADILLLGWFNSMPSPKIIDAAMKIKERGLVKYLAMSGHHRPAFPEVARKDIFDIFHIRYNAAHRGAETEVFPKLPENGRPGIVVYTATRWGNLLNPKKMPPAEKTPSGSDCYRFVLSNPSVDVCMTGPKNREEMQEALKSLDKGPMSEDEMNRMRRVGDHVHKKGMFNL